MYAYDIQFTVIPIYKAMKDRSMTKLRMINFLTCSACVIVYISYCIVGFLTSPAHPTELIIFRNALKHPDILMTIGKLLVCINLVREGCVNLNLSRLSFFQAIRSSEAFTTKE